MEPAQVVLVSLTDTILAMGYISLGQPSDVNARIVFLLLRILKFFNFQ